MLQKSLEKDKLAQFKFTFQPNPAASPKTAVREKVGDLYDKRLEKQFAAGPSNPKPKLFLSSAKESSKSIQETPAHSSRKRNRSNTTTAKQSKKAKKVHVGDNSTAIDMANKLNAAMGNILVPNSSDEAESMEVDEDPIQAAEGSGSGGTIQIDEPINLTPEVTMVNQDVDDAAPSSDSGTGGINFGGN